MIFSAYVLYAPVFRKIYIGQTDDLEERITAHNGKGKYVTWACRYKPWVLLHAETFATRKEAMKKEKQLKSGGGRRFIRTLLEQRGWSPPAGG